MRRLVEEHVDHRILVARHPARDEEPQPVLLERTAYRHVAIIEVNDLARGRQATVAQFVSHVVALQAGAGSQDGGGERERVGARLGNLVDHDAGAAVLGRDAAGFHSRFLREGRVGEVAI